MSAAPGQDLSLAPQPAFPHLTSLKMSHGGALLPSAPTPALYLWLSWALPAATQLRKLSISREDVFEGEDLRPFHVVTCGTAARLRSCPMACVFGPAQCCPAQCRLPSLQVPYADDDSKPLLSGVFATQTSLAPQTR